MRFFLSFCFLAALASVTAAKSVTFGKRSFGDRLLYRENVLRYPLPGIEQEVYITFPKLGSTERNPGNVSAIYVYDRFTNSSGATPMRLVPVIKAKSSRFNSTIIILKSKRSQGINSTIDFYGKK